MMEKYELERECQESWKGHKPAAAVASSLSHTDNGYPKLEV